MAIAFDAYKAQVGAEPGTSITSSFTISGSDRGLLVGVFNQNASYRITGVTYAGVAMTLVDTQKNGTNNEYIGLYYLANPTTGANNIVVSASSSIYMYLQAVSLTGVSQASMLNTSAKNQANAVTSISVTPTTTADDCWAVSMVRNDTGSITDSTNFSIRGAANSIQIGDSNASVGTAGSKTVTAGGPSGKMAIVTAMIAPAAAASSIKTFNGLAYASTKTVDGLAAASVKTWGGLA